MRVALILATFATLYSFGQETPQQNEQNLNRVESSVIINPSPSVSTVTFGSMKTESQNIDLKYQGQYEQDKCASYRKMKIVGIVLAAVGGGMIVTGSIIMGAARANYYNEGNNNNNVPAGNYYAMYNGGSAMVGLGIVGLGAGIPLAIIGSVKEHRYCGGVYDRERYNNRSYISTTGNGLALNF
jgi:hypothetical protein